MPATFWRHFSFRLTYLGSPIAGLLDVLLEIHVSLHELGVLFLQDLKLAFQITHVLELLLVGLDGHLILVDFVRRFP